MTKNIDFSGNSNVIIRAYEDYTINGIEYKKNQIITYLNNINFSLIMESNSKVIKTTKTKAHFTDFIPLQAAISNITLTSGIADLIFADKNSDAMYIPALEKSLSDSSGILFLNQIDFDLDSIFIYQDGQVITGYTVDSAGQVSGLNPDTEYLISYEVKTEIEQNYTIARRNLPYFSIEVFNRGNVNAEGKDLLIKIPKVALTGVPDLNLSSGALISTELIFKIIDSTLNFIYY